MYIYVIYKPNSGLGHSPWARCGNPGKGPCGPLADPKEVYSQCRTKRIDLAPDGRIPDEKGLYSQRRKRRIDLSPDGRMVEKEKRALALTIPTKLYIVSLWRARLHLPALCWCHQRVSQAELGSPEISTASLLT